jgi:hypothetical protein
MVALSEYKQLTIAEFDWSFDTALDENNRWVHGSKLIGILLEDVLSKL